MATILFYDKKPNNKTYNKNERAQRIQKLKKRYGENNKFLSISEGLAELYRLKEDNNKQ
jgi:hypothetical protein